MLVTSSWGSLEEYDDEFIVEFLNRSQALDVSDDCKSSLAKVRKSIEKIERRGKKEQVPKTQGSSYLANLVLIYGKGESGDEIILTNLQVNSYLQDPETLEAQRIFYFQSFGKGIAHPPSYNHSSFRSLPVVLIPRPGQMGLQGLRVSSRGRGDRLLSKRAPHALLLQL